LSGIVVVIATNRLRKAKIYSSAVQSAEEAWCVWRCCDVAGCAI